MRLEQVELPGNILKVKLQGSLDLAGAEEIELPFSVICNKWNKVIVELTNVTFLASIGIRLLVKAARALGSKKGRLIVFNPTDDTRRVLRSTGIDTIIPVVADEGAAIAACAR